MTKPVRRPIHRGSALAHGVFVDARALGEERARRRVLGLSSAVREVHLFDRHLVALFREPVRLQADASPGGLLLLQNHVLSSAPLEKAEVESLGAADGAVVLVIGGVPRVLVPGEATRQDMASWLDVADFEVEEDVEPLGQAFEEPAARVRRVAVDVRASLGVGEAPEGAEAARRALFEGAVSGAGGAGEGARGGTLGGALAQFFQTLGAVLSRPRSGSGAGAATGMRGAGGTGGVRGAGGTGGAGAGSGSVIGSFFQALGALLSRFWSPSDPRPAPGESTAGGSRALAVRDMDRPAYEPFLSSLMRGLRMAAARFLLWSRLARHVGRRQAEYLSRMFDMFDRGDLDEALRHAVPLGGSGGPAAPALGTPSPRSELTISPHGAGSGTAMFGTADLLAEMRRRYRRAFEQLAEAGEIEKAAFVLAELLHADEEAVSFLEKHRRFRLAAEIAEARNLPDGLVVRQWFLAGDRARAMAIARAKGAFADAVHRLTSSGHADEAAALRVLWADGLASAGDYPAAVDVIWPVEHARRLALTWLDRAIAIGGPSGARMALRKLTLLPDAFDEVRALALGFLREPGEDGLANARALGAEVLDKTHRSRALAPGPRALAKPILRALLRSVEKDDSALGGRLLDAIGDAALQTDVRRSRGLHEPRALDGAAGVQVTAAAFTRAGSARRNNEDACLAATLGAPNHRENVISEADDAARNGFVLGVFDGTGGWPGGTTAGNAAASAILSAMRSSFTARGEAALGRAIGPAVEAANTALHRRQSDPKYRGSGATAVVATVAGTTLFVAHVGECRAYLWRAGRLSRLTEDHSLLAEMIRAGKLVTPEEIEAFPHKNVVIRALGMTETTAVDVASTELCDGDVLLLCSDGLWNAVPDDVIAEKLGGASSPAGMVTAVVGAAALRRAPDDTTVAVARFVSRPVRGAARAPVAMTPVSAGQGSSPADPSVRAPVTMTPLRAEQGPSEQDASTPLVERREPVAIRRSEHDTGAVRIRDAAELPDGRILVALGELGSRIISREGRTLTAFAEPAHAIVLSDHGDRALVLAWRGEVTRIARLDLATRRQQPWCDARLGAFAPDFDGATWYVAAGSTLHAIDATCDGWEHHWNVDAQDAGAQDVDDSAAITKIARSATAVTAVFEQRDHRRIEVWRYELPSHTLRARFAATPFVDDADAGKAHPIAVSPSGTLAVLVNRTAPEGPAPPPRVSLHGNSNGKDLHAEGPFSRAEGVIQGDWLLVRTTDPATSGLAAFDVATLQERLRVTFDGFAFIRSRIARDRALVFDDRGRLLVISLRTGSVLRDLRLS